MRFAQMFPGEHFVRMEVYVRECMKWFWVLELAEGSRSETKDWLLDWA